MAAQKRGATVEVNLLPSDDLEGRPGGKFLLWALTWGKRIVIITEAVVILAFLSRFWLDTVVADLSEQITAKKNVIVASANFEEKFRRTATRIEEAKAIESQGSVLVVLDKVRTLIPANVGILQMNVGSTDVSFVGESDESSLAILVSSFKNSPKFTDLAVNKITKTGQSQTITFSVKTKYVWP